MSDEYPVRKITKRGIWQESRYELVGSHSAPTKDSIFNSMPKLTTEQQIEAQYTGYKKVAAKELAKAGLPTEPEMYRKNARGDYEWATISDGAVTWSEVKPLSREKFAIQLILKCDDMIQSAKAGENQWIILRHALGWANSYFEFFTEHRGIARLAETGIATRQGQKESRAAKRSRADMMDEISYEIIIRSREFIWNHKTWQILKVVAAPIRAAIRERLGKDAPRKDRSDSVIKKDIAKARKRFGAKRAGA